MDAQSIQAIQTALTSYQPGDLLALSDLHESLLKAVTRSPDSPLALDLHGCALTIEAQLAGGSYDLDDLFFEAIETILARAGRPQSVDSAPLPGSVLPGDSPVNPEYIQTFCLELADRLGQAQELILKLETKKASEEDRNVLFRLFHTIKGEAGFLKLSVLMTLFHSLEGLLDGLRKEKLALSAGVIDCLFEGVDLAEGAGRSLANSTDLSGLSQPTTALGRRVSALLAGANLELTLPVIDTPKLHETQGRQEENLVKVAGAKLSYLVDMVGEMLILQNQMPDDTKETQMLRKVSREVQQAAMSLRTVNLKPLFTKMRRAVRDVSLQLDKPVEVEVIGETNEIDRSLVEAMEEPLIHLVRNCIGHGIEDQQARLGTQKSPEGRVVLSAERRGNHVIFGIEDDGKGLDPAAILTSALKNGVIAPQVAETLTNEQIYELIFLDGLSTAERVDDISGRGVGMSIVKKTVERFRGHIHIKTVKGGGTRFDLVFPLSMAILDGMIIELGTEKFILPVENVLEAVRIQPHLLVEISGGGRVLRLRGDVVPVVDLTDFFYGDQPHDRGVAVLVENNQHDRFALLVERVLEKREVVIKSLGRRFQNLVGISAAAIMRGGEIGYLVDIDAITRPGAPRLGDTP